MSIAGHHVEGVPPDDFRAALGRFATGVTVVTAHVDDDLHGMTANAFSAVSLVPPLVLVCVDRSAVLHAALPDLDAFAVSVLARSQRHLSVWFADPGRPAGSEQFRGVRWHGGSLTGLPLLSGAAAALECVKEALHPGGDHTILVGRVLGTHVDPAARPLLYLDGGYLDF